MDLARRSGRPAPELLHADRDRYRYCGFDGDVASRLCRAVQTRVA